MNSPIDLDAIKERAGRSINTALFDGSDDEYEHAVQFVLDHQSLIDEVERLRDLAYPAPLPLSYSAGDDPPSLWWQSAPVAGPPDYVGTPGDSGWPFTADDDPIWVPMPTLSADRPKVTP